MTPLARWLKFNAVGVLGMGVQLVALALLNRWLRGRYLVASAVALELTLLHNFWWHMRFTWRDRAREERARALLRFHVSNGLVSLAGNLVLMRVLVSWGHVPVVAANLCAIVCCSLLNFALANLWAFPALKQERA